ncbi:O-acetylhomoserine aminocarboxypropyltransferase/cysteine synthase [Candidatus Bealeia paramacronuclearis]|uniref:O-acetylhomoserine aminocarboxypropyltransferase/cysteine synthase n=1 Tax=Candidatus Bealeia paramacronuclearis TaxID=1921001 RepID=A0ABZ2C294_9PROT|nr:O-acetylhomoserine aminocarboxypropyltransferase/cysteine synthase [Candidatus Bealeia paramacronuclearis]
MNEKDHLHFETLSIHAGDERGMGTPLAIPITQTVAYRFKSIADAANLFSLEAEGSIYSRLTNPTVEILEKRIAALEGGIGAVAVSSGLAANLLALFPLMGPGLEFIASNRLYGGSIAQFHEAFEKFGWHCHFVNIDDFEGIKNLITEKTRAIFCESQANPSTHIADIEILAEIAHTHDIPLIVDNTIPSPYLIKPFLWGADIVVHSTTKFINGHGTSMGGIVVDGGTFPWKDQPHFQSLHQPSGSYHGLQFIEKFPNAAYITYARSVGLRDLGFCQSAFNAFDTLKGIDTLSLRMEKHVKNGLKIATFLEKHPQIEKVHYAGLPGSPYFKRAQKYSPQGISPVFCFDLKGGYDAGVKLVENCKLFAHAATIGEATSLIIHPASTTHKQLEEGQLKSAGISPNTIRLSVGIENVDDLIQDLEKAL